MKRSEMVLMIAECLIEPHFPDDVLKEADCILKKLEKFGMLPPDQNKDVEPPCAVMTYWEEE